MDKISVTFHSHDNESMSDKPAKPNDKISLVVTPTLEPENEIHLNDSQERFCQEYLKDLNGTQAAIRAGYSAHTSNEQAARLLAKVSVKARVQELMAQRQVRTQLTADKVLKDIEDVRQRCMQGEPVLDREGNPTGEWKFEAHAALKASELQGKHMKMFTDKVEHSGQINVANVTDEELDKRIEALMRAAEEKK